jgi:FKBP-type peptidyl-prolyl cis-trans isomerase FklB
VSSQTEVNRGISEMASNRSTRVFAVAVFVIGSALVSGATRAAQDAAPQRSTASVTDIQLSFKRDARMVDSFRGIGAWVTGSNYTGATAQDTVEVRAKGVDARGNPVKINAEWSASDTQMVTVSPAHGDDVTIAVHKAGESKLKVTYQGVSKELVVRAQYVGKFMVFEIAPPSPTKHTGAAATEAGPALKSQKEQISYAAGMRLGKTLRKQSVEVDPDLVEQGLKDIVSGGPTLMSDDQVQTALMGVETELNVTEAVLEREKVAKRNQDASEQFLAENKKKEGVVSLSSGLQYKVLKAGDGKKPTALDVAVCQYKGSLIDGTEFDNSYKRKDGGPVNFPVKAVIKGWQEALRLMPAGSRWQIVVPPDLAYGERGVPRAKIPPNAALVFDVELLAVKEPGYQAPPASKSVVTPQQIDALKKTIQAQEREAETKSENVQ